MMRKRTTWVSLAVALFLCLALVSLVVPYANAQSTSTATTAPNNPQRELDCGAEPWGCIFGVVIFLISGLGAFVVMVGAFLLKLALIMSPGIVDAPVVRQGFAITLAFANLGFIFAIVVMAIGTMLRMQSYGMKQMLWKLVVAAVLVNFSLVIAGAILNIADRIALYFVGQGVPAIQSDGSLSSLSSNYGTFVEDLTVAFKPQAFQRSMNWGKALDADVLGVTVPGLGVLGTFANLLTTPFTDFSGTLRYFLHVIFAFVFTALIGLSFLAATIMLFIRYIAIGILLILMPFAWLLWLFPSLSSHFTKWWNAFIRWAFFAPILTFFLYLAIFAATNTASKDNITASVDKAAERVPVRGGTQQGGPPGSAAEQDRATSYAVSEFLTGDTGIVRVGAEQMLIIALAWGGLFSANYLSIMGAGAAMKTFQGWGKGAAAGAGAGALGAAAYGGGKLKRGAQRAISAPFRKVDEETGLTRADRWRAGAARIAQNAAARGGITGFLARQTVGRAARGFAKGTTVLAEAGENQVKHFKEKHKNKTAAQAEASAVGAAGPELVALLQLMKEKGKINIAMSHRKGVEDLFMKFNQAKEYSEIQSKSGVSRKMYEDELEGASEPLKRQHAEEFYRTLDGADVRAFSNDLHSGKAKFGLTQESLAELAKMSAHGFTETELASTAKASMNSKSLINFNNAYAPAIETMEDPGRVVGTKVIPARREITDPATNIVIQAAQPERREDITIQQKRRDAWRNSMAGAGLQDLVSSLAPVDVNPYANT